MNKQMLNKVFKEHELDAIISLAPQTRLWYAKVQTSDGWLFIEPKKADLLVDGRYIEHAKANAKNVNVFLLNRELLEKHVQTKSYKVIGIEKDYLTIADFNRIKLLFPNAKFVEIVGQALRIIKSDDEIAIIKEAAAIGLKALKELEPEIKAGAIEKDLDNKLIFLMKKYGAEKNSFDTIVASGQRSSLPHGRASAKTLNDGELVTIDFGAVYKGYCSDITRTFHVGKVTNPKLLEIETILREAQKMGVAAVKPGVTTADIDKVCRDFIKLKGYENNFTHGTGHGLGIDVHELPYVSSSYTPTVLEPGMVITVEPGIYIEGIGGIRVEDDVLVTKDGYEILSR